MLGFSISTEENPIRILLVEDNETNQRLMDDFLSRWCGYQVTSIRDGADFFPALREIRPHLILLDLKLPNVDGFTLLLQLRASKEWQHVPVIVVSAYAFKSDRQKAMNLGANQYFVKPVNLQEVQQGIETELRLAKTQNCLEC